MNKLKVLFITHYSAYYGANRSLLHLIDDLKDRYHIQPIILYSNSGKNELEYEIKKRNYQSYIYSYISWCTSDDRYKIVKNLYYDSKNKFLLKPILKIVKRIAPDIIHCNSSIVNIGYDIAKKLNIPCVWQVREFGKHDYGLKYRYTEKKVAQIYENVNVVVAISKAMEDYYKQISPRANICTIYNGIPEFNTIKLQHDRLNFCIMGLISKEKNQIDVLRAANILIKNNINDFIINLIGDGDENYLEKLKTYCFDNHLNQNVKFWGYHHNGIELLNTMDVGIMPSYNEAFGRVTVEYMMSEMPVIGSNSGGTPEIIIHNETGFLYEPQDIKGLAKYMSLYIENNNLLVVHGENGRKRALAHFEAKKNTDNIFQLYQKLLQ